MLTKIRCPACDHDNYKLFLNKTGLQLQSCFNCNLVFVNPRPTEVETLLCDLTKAKEQLGWTPKITLKEMVQEMMESDLNIAKRDELIKQHGYKAFDYNK